MSFMQADMNGEGGGSSYNVHSLYLDSADWSIYRETIGGHFSRYKLRARTYAFTPDAPVFLEVKQREGEAMWKSRAEVSRRDAIRVLNRQPLENVPPSPALDRFLAEMDRRHAVPRVWVTYLRNALVGEDRKSLVRITFDRNICCAPSTPALTEPPVWYPLPAVKGIVILELKYNRSYPGWLASFIRQFGLERKAMSKYRHSVDLLRSQELAANAEAQIVNKEDWGDPW